MCVLRVLLLTGERDFAGAFRALVRAFGHHVETYYDEPEAILAARDGAPHVIFVDQTASAEDGSLLCRFAREESLTPVRLVSITTDDTSENLSALRDAGLDFRFAKPLVAGELERFLAVSKTELLGE